jgi:hypothetical protein
MASWCVYELGFDQPAKRGVGAVVVLAPSQRVG